MKKNSKLESQQSFYDYRNYIDQLDKEFQVGILGKKIRFDNFSIFNNSERNSNSSRKNWQVLITVDINSCAPCYREALNYFLLKKKKDDYFSYVRINVIFPLADIQNVQSISEEFQDENLCFMIYKNFNLKNELNTDTDQSAVLFLDHNQKCVYGFLLEPNNPTKIVEKTKILENFLNDAVY